MEKITKEQMAARLNDNEYRNEMTKEDRRIAKESNLLVLYGASDDLLVLSGVIDDDRPAYEGGDFALMLKGELYADGEEENTYHRALDTDVIEISDEYENDNNPRLVHVEWCPTSDPSLSWRITSNLPYASFKILDDGEPYCEGIVIDLSDVKPIPDAAV